MRVSMKMDYGVRALVDLAQRCGMGPVQTNEIAARQSIPEPYLDQLLTTLRKAGFIRSKRGPQGGHMLARLPSQISLGEVIAALEGSLSPVSCFDEGAECPRSEVCAQRDVWRSVQEATRSVLNATSLEQLAERQASEERAMYHI